MSYSFMVPQIHTTQFSFWTVFPAHRVAWARTSWTMLVFPDVVFPMYWPCCARTRWTGLVSMPYPTSAGFLMDCRVPGSTYG